MYSTETTRTEEWVVCFSKAGRKHWIQKFLNKDFQHCYAFKLSPGGKFFMIVDPIRSYTMIDLMPANEEAFNELTENATFLTVIATIELSKDRGHFCRFNCVEMVKALIGLKSFWTFTPYQLFRRLEKWAIRSEQEKADAPAVNSVK